MKNIMNTMVQYFENVPDQMRRRRLFVWLFFIAATVFFIFGMGRAKFDMSIEGWFEANDPTVSSFDWFHSDFGSEDHLYIVYKPKDGDVFSEKSLKAIKGIQTDLINRMSQLKKGDESPLKHIVKITSLINAPVLRAEGDTLISKKLVGDNVPASSQELDNIRQVAESQKSFPLFYFSRDHKYGGMLVETDFGAIPLDSETTVTKDLAFSGDLGASDSSTGISRSAGAERPKFKPTNLPDYRALMEEVKIILNKPEYADLLEYYPVGNTAKTEYDLQMITEMGMLNVAALLIIALLLWFLFRSFSAVVWPIVMVILSVIWTVGLTGWIGLPITSFIMITVMLTLTVGVADGVHVMSGYLSSRNEGHDHRLALRLGFRHVAVACLLTTVTNIVAVLALNITPIVPIQVFGFMCALGVGFPFIFSVYLLPLMLDLWAPKNIVSTPKNPISAFISRVIPNFAVFLARQLEKVLPRVQKTPITFIVIFMALFAVCLFGATKTKVDTDPVGSFPKTSKIRQSFDVVDKNMMGAQSMEIYIDMGKENAFHDPFVLNIMDKLQRKIEQKYSASVVRTTSLVDTVKNSYKTLNEGREEMYIIPPTKEAVSQTLFLFNSADPEDRRKQVSDNYDKSHISVRLYNTGSYEYTKVWDLMRKDIDESREELKQKYPDANVSITGMLALLMQGADYLTANELQSFGFALLFVSIILLVLFGSLKAGLIALIPNLIPAILAYGLLGLLNIPLDITTMMIAPIIIGIAVDDTVHFLTHYRNYVMVDGDILKALQKTITDAGQSIVFTTLVLGLGFGIMSFSSNQGTANLGILGSLAIVIGLLNDLFLLPAMIIVFKLKFKKPAVESTPFAEPDLSSTGAK